MWFICGVRRCVDVCLFVLQSHPQTDPGLVAVCTRTLQVCVFVCVYVCVYVCMFVLLC